MWGGEVLEDVQRGFFFLPECRVAKRLLSNTPLPTLPTLLHLPLLLFLPASTTTYSSTSSSSFSYRNNSSRLLQDLH